MAIFVPRFFRQQRDVLITNPQAGDVPTYDSADEKWKNEAGGGGGGDLTDAVILAPASSARNVIQPTAGDVIAAIVKAHAAQSVDLTQWQLSDGTPFVTVGPISPTGDTAYGLRAILDGDGWYEDIFDTGAAFPYLYAVGLAGRMHQTVTANQLGSQVIGTGGVAVVDDAFQRYEISGLYGLARYVGTYAGVGNAAHGIQGIHGEARDYDEDIVVASTAAAYNHLRGGHVVAGRGGSGITNDVTGFFGEAFLDGSSFPNVGATGRVVGGHFDTTVAVDPANATITELNGLRLGRFYIGTPQKITTAYGIRIMSSYGAAGVGTSYGIHIAAQTGADTASYAIYAAGGKSVFVDGIVIALLAAPADATYANGHGGWWWDQANSLPKWKGKTAGAVVVNFTPADAAALAAHLADTSDAHDASAISILDTAGDFTATDVEEALAELQAADEADEAALAAHLVDGADAHDASAVSVLDSGTNYTATDVEGVLAEIAPLLGGGGGAPTTAPYVTTAGDAGLSAEVVLGTGVIMSGTLAARPAASIEGRLYFATDVDGGTLYRDTGAAWVQVASGLNRADPPALICYSGHPAAALAGGVGIGNANRVRGARVIVPKTGTLNDLYVYIGVQSGNIEAGILNTTVTTRNRLWTTGSIACPATGWQKMGDPGLAVTEGDQLDFYCGADNGTAQFMRCLGVVTAASSALPTVFFPASAGGKPTMTWEGPAATFPLGATLAEASMTATANAFSLFARVS